MEKPRGCWELVLSITVGTEVVDRLNEIAQIVGVDPGMLAANLTREFWDTYAIEHLNAVLADPGLMARVAAEVRASKLMH